MNTMPINQIVELIQKDMEQVNALILSQLNSDVFLINQIGHYIVGSGGKRIRPMIALLAARALNYSGEHHITTSAFIEFIHTATLIHDDVVDESDMRRGKSTANLVFGNAASVLVGDFIYTRSFQMMTSIQSFRALEIMSAATNVIAEGEVQQLINCNNPDVTEADYLDVIYRKTARLFEAATQTAAIISHATPEQESALQLYGRYLGTAFQLIDDMLDYSAAGSESLGKNLGDDLSEGKPTLPLLHAMQNGTDTESALIRRIIEEGDGRDYLEQVLAIMQKYGSLAYTKTMAVTESDKAIAEIQILPDSEFKRALISLAKISVQREY